MTNIRPDGSIDMSADELAQLEFVLVAPHAALRSEDDQTIRMITALTTPGVHVLGHPRGRQYGTRSGVHANWDDVFIAAAHALASRSRSTAIRRDRISTSS